MFKKSFLITSVILLSESYAHAADIKHPVVLELFTSQGCSSCPPADDLLKKLSASDQDLLPLSFHVHYWDNLGWKDTYSSPAYTNRQKSYEQALGERRLFTPQLIVNGMKSVVGFDADAVEQAIAMTKEATLAVNVSLKPTGHQLIAGITANNPTAPIEAELWEVRFDREAKTAVAAGENNGRTLESINNVTSITSLGTWHSGESKSIPLDIPSSGMAIIVQTPQQGPILGAAAYIH